MGGLFLVRDQHSSWTKDSPTLLLRQEVGQPQASESVDSGTDRLRSVRGGAFPITNVVDQACGTVTDCTGDASGFSYAAGAACWITPYLAAEGPTSSLPEMTATGTAGNFRFNSSLTPTSDGRRKGRRPLGPFQTLRPNRRDVSPGEIHHVADADDATENATQTFSQKTRGWSWVFGGR